MKKRTIFSILIVITVAGCASDQWDTPVIPVTLKGIEAVNIDNSGEFPLISGSTIKKEAYMLGIKWIANDIPSDEEDDKFISAPIQKGEQTYTSIADNYSKAIKCKTPFNSDIPAGKYISKYFKEIDRNYLPVNVDEGFVLLVAPDPGEHLFTIEYYIDNELKFSCDTPPIEFF